MFDINGEEFLVGDTLKVIKECGNFKAGEVVVCSYDDGSDCCGFKKVGGVPQGLGLWVENNTLQKL